MSILHKLYKNDLVRELPKIDFDLDKVCDACTKGKHKRVSFKPINDVSMIRTASVLSRVVFVLPDRLR